MKLDVFNIAIGVALAVLGHLVAFLRLKWKAQENRRSDWEKIRRPIYAEAFKLLSAIDEGRGNADRFETEIKNLADWIPANASYLSPRGNDFIYRTEMRGAAYSCDINNRDVDPDTRRGFLDTLQAAKEFFVQNQDIRWLPKDRE